MAVICFDWAIETLLKTIKYVCEPKSGDRDPQFSGLWDEVDKQIAKYCGSGMRLPSKAAIKRFREVRNSAQHEGIAPDETEVREGLAVATSFLRQVADDLWHIDLDDVSEAKLVRNAAVRERLQPCEWILRNKDRNRDEYMRASQDARRVLDHVVGRISRHLVRFVVPTLDASFNVPEMRYTESRLNALEESLILLALGIDRLNHLECMRLTGHMYYSAQHPGGGFVFGTAKATTYKDARWVLDYCTDVILDLEAKVGDLAAPFG